jgi:hypothetical protein
MIKRSQLMVLAVFTGLLESGVSDPAYPVENGRLYDECILRYCTNITL